jgi:hypothetical protein
MIYFWTIGGEWHKASSISELVEFYKRSGNMQNFFVAVEADLSGNKTDITAKIRAAAR